MTQSTNMPDEIQQIMTDSLFLLKKLLDIPSTQLTERLSIVNLFLVGIMSTTADLLELEFPGSAPMVYADMEAAAKSGGLKAITTMQEKTAARHYSVSNIAPDDMSTAMNYLGEQLSIALFKGLHELPLPLRQTETMLRAIEALLANLLSQKFDNSHTILDNLCEHVHMALNNLELRKH